MTLDWNRDRKVIWLILGQPFWVLETREHEMGIWKNASEKEEIKWEKKFSAFDT